LYDKRCGQGQDKRDTLDVTSKNIFLSILFAVDTYVFKGLFQVQAALKIIFFSKLKPQREI